MFCLMVASITFAQKNLFEALEANGETITYEGFEGLTADGDGTYTFERSKSAVTIKVEKLPSGQPVGFKATYVESNKGAFGETEVSDYGRVDSYPNVMTIKHSHAKSGYMVIDDLVFFINDIPNDGLPKIENVKQIYVAVKEREEAKEKEETGKKKKKKGGFLAKMKSKIESVGAVPTTPTHKYLKSLDLDTIFNDYITAMKAKQATPATAKDKADMAKIKHAREAVDEEIRRYNDSIKATPAYARIQQNERNYQASKQKNDVTLRNNSGSIIYVGRSGSRNRGTKISSGGTASWNCNQDAYIQSVSTSGGSTEYNSTSNRVYSSNSGCGSTVNIN